MTTNLCELFVYLYCLFLFLLHFLFGRWMRYKHVVAVVDATPCLHVYRRNLQLGCWFCCLLHGKYTSPISYHADCLRYRLIRCGLLRWSHYTAWNLVRPCFQKLPKTFVSNNIAFGVKIISFNNATTHNICNDLYNDGNDDDGDVDNDGADVWFVQHVRWLYNGTELEADLFYVHEGTINTYAMHFTVPVPADVHDLEFSWQSLTAYPVSFFISKQQQQHEHHLSNTLSNFPTHTHIHTPIHMYNNTRQGLPWESVDRQTNINRTNRLNSRHKTPFPTYISTSTPPTLHEFITPQSGSSYIKTLSHSV